MKKLNKKGFTLIELLAVIVVLAILMLVAVQNIFPMIANARANSFVSTVENIRDAANNKYVSDLLSTTYRTKKCYTVAQLVKQSYVSVDATNIFGAVCVNEGDNGNSQFEVLIYDKANGYLYDTGLITDATGTQVGATGTKVKVASPTYIQTTASSNSNVNAYFYDVAVNDDISAIFTEDGVKDGTTIKDEMACYGLPVTGTAAFTNYNKCFSTSKFEHHVFK